MDRVNIYITTESGLKQAIVKLAEKVYSEGYRTTFLCKDAQDTAMVDNMLWTATQMFIPHGTSDGPFASEHHVLITHNVSAIQKAGCLITLNKYIDGDFINSVAIGYSIVVHIFDSSHDNINLRGICNEYAAHERVPLVWEHKNGQWSRQHA